MPPATASNAVPFNRSHVQKLRDRAALRGDQHFLKHHVIAQLNDRLSDIKRSYDLALILGASSGTPPSIANHIITADLSFQALRMMSGSTKIQCTEDFLPFRSHSFDMVYSPLCLHSVNDLPGALIQINRCLKADGLFIGALFGGETLYELRQCLTEAEMNVTGGISPRVFPFADKPQIGALLQRTGFALPVVDSEIVSVTYPDMAALMKDLRLMGESNAIAARRKTFTRRRVFELAAQYYHARFAEDDGRIIATFEIIYMIGWAPHHSQQKPLRPGSAEARLSEFLNTEEIKI